jgi:hypothetical protein
MSNLLDDLFSGGLSRRQFVELASKAASLCRLLNLALAEVAAQSVPKAQDGPKFSPANIAAAAVWSGTSIAIDQVLAKVPMVEGYSILDAKTQEVQPWPESSARVYLNFSGNVIWIPRYGRFRSKALIERHQLLRTDCLRLAGRGHTTFQAVKKQNKFDWAEGSLFRSQ